MAAHRLSVDQYVRGVVEGDRSVLGRALSLVESGAPRDRALADELLVRLLPKTGGALRLGITGVPGAGKSSFIEAMGMPLLGAGHRVAVLAVDPSSVRSGGSILGDKTRMSRLGREERAFIRPSPTGGALGGVARRTREQLLVCEAAGFDVVIVETVGVGQSEVSVAGLVDTFLLLLIPGAGDELQGIKRGVVELADLVVVNKADGDALAAAREAAQDISSALRYLVPAVAQWRPPVLLASALEGTGISEVWQQVLAHRAALEAAGQLHARRAAQERAAMWRAVEDALVNELRLDPELAEVARGIEEDIDAGRLVGGIAAQRLVDAWHAQRR